MSLSVDPRHLSHRDDPITSKLAGLSDYESQNVLFLFAGASLVDFTQEELGLRAGKTRRQAERRTSNLLELGHFRRIEGRKRILTTGRMGGVCEVSDQGWESVDVLRDVFGVNPPLHIYRRGVSIPPAKDAWLTCLWQFNEWDGLTYEEVCDLTGLREWQVVPRITELQGSKYSYLTGAPLIEVFLRRDGTPGTRTLRSGKQGQVYRITGDGEEIVRHA